MLKFTLSYLNLLFVNIIVQIVFYSTSFRNTAFKRDLNAVVTILSMQIKNKSSRTFANLCELFSKLCEFSVPFRVPSDGTNEQV